jgi:UDP-N-acetylmuramate--L-alanine ligase
VQWLLNEAVHECVIKRMLTRQETSQAIKLKYKSVYFAGVAGTGMSGLAQYQAQCGGIATGSDRAIDRGSANDAAEKLATAGVKIVPQDGKYLTKDLDVMVVSTAIEDSVPEVQKAKELAIPIIHRSEYLADITSRYKTISVTGTNGKSTVAAMIFDILDYAGTSPSLLTGANLVSLEDRGLLGNCFIGNSDWLVIEADESDGSLTRYTSEIGILLNMEKDHKDVDELKRYFSEFKDHSHFFILNGDKENLIDLRDNATVFHTEEISSITLEPDCSSFHYQETDFYLPLPGLQNVENALAALTVCGHVGVTSALSSKALKQFKGVARRFQLVGTRKNIRVTDDYAHNPAKVSAALKTAQLTGGRVLAYFQLHGYGPTKFMKNELIESFADSLNGKDILWMSEIYYAGGTADKTISSEDIVKGIIKRGREVRFIPKRDDIIPEIVSSAREGDTILIMGARDHTLHQFARDVLNAL